MTSIQLRDATNNVGTVPFYGTKAGFSPDSSPGRDIFSKEFGPSLLADKLTMEYQKIDTMERRIRELAEIDGLPQELFVNELQFLKNARQIIASFIEQCQGLMGQIVRNIG